MNEYLLRDIMRDIENEATWHDIADITTAIKKRIIYLKEREDDENGKQDNE